MKKMNNWEDVLTYVHLRLAHGKCEPRPTWEERVGQTKAGGEVNGPQSDSAVLE